MRRPDNWEAMSREDQRRWLREVEAKDDAEYELIQATKKAKIARQDAIELQRIARQEREEMASTVEAEETRRIEVEGALTELLVFIRRKLDDLTKLFDTLDPVTHQQTRISIGAFIREVNEELEQYR